MIYVLAAIGIVILEWYFSRKGWLPFLSFVLVISFAGILLKLSKQYVLFSGTLLSIFCASVALGIIYSFDHPLINEIRKSVNDLFCKIFDTWMRIPLAVHRGITIAYAMILLALYPPIHAVAKRR